MATATTVTEPTRAELDEYFANKEKARLLASQARAAEKLCEIREKQISAWLEQKTAETGKTAFQKAGFVIQFKPGQVRPKWQDEFILACGAKKAEEVIARTPRGQTLSVTKANTV